MEVNHSDELVSIWTINNLQLHPVLAIFYCKSEFAMAIHRANSKYYPFIVNCLDSMR